MFYSSWRQWHLQQFLKHLVKFFVQNENNKIPSNVIETRSFQMFDFSFLQLLVLCPSTLFLSVGVLQQLAWVHRCVQKELEAESRWGQLLFPTRPQPPSIQTAVSTQSVHRSLKKTKARPRSDKQCGKVDFTATLYYSDDSNDFYCVSNQLWESRC